MVGETNHFFSVSFVVEFQEIEIKSGEIVFFFFNTKRKLFGWHSLAYGVCVNRQVQTSQS